MSEIITSAQVAERLGVSPATVRNWRRRGQGPEYINIGPKLVAYRIEAVEAYIEARSVMTSDPRPASKMALVLAELQHHPSGITATDMAQLTDTDSNTAATCMWRLTKAGQARRLSRGVYAPAK